MTYYLSAETSRIEAVGIQQFEPDSAALSKSSTGRKISVTLGGISPVGDVELPTRIVVEAWMPKQTSPYRHDEITLYDIKVNDVDVSAAMKPIWPDDAILLDVETKDPAKYLADPDKPRNMIMLADYYLGIEDREQAQVWVDKLQQSLAGRIGTPDEVANTARLLTRIGDPDAADELHTSTQKRVLTTPPEDGHNRSQAESEELFARYMVEYGFFLARRNGGYHNETAATYVMNRAREMRTPFAIAVLCGRASDHARRARNYDEANQFLDECLQRVRGDKKATQWLNACRKLNANATNRGEYFSRLRSKRREIASLRDQLDQLTKQGDGAESPRVRLLRMRLKKLETTP